MERMIFMNNTLCKFLVFAAGAAIGSVVTWKLVDKKYMDLADEEIESVREAYGRRLDEMKEELKTELKEKVEDVDSDDSKEADHDWKKELVEEKATCEDIIKRFNYRQCSEKEEETEVEYVKPYVIPPEEFGESEFQPVTYIMYNDGTIIDDYDNVVTDVERLLTREALNSFGQYEEDSVYVRNENTKMDYEILLDVRNYSDENPGAED